MLDPIVGQDGKIRHLRAGAGGGGNGREDIAPTAEIGHGLCAVHGAAAAQCHDQVRPEGLHPSCPRRRQLHRWVRDHLIEYFRYLRLSRPGHRLGCSVFLKERVRHQQQPFGMQICQPGNRPGPGNDFRFAGEVFHCIHRLFNGSMSQPQGNYV